MSRAFRFFAAVLCILIVAYNIPPHVRLANGLRRAAQLVVEPMLTQRWTLFAPNLPRTQVTVYATATDLVDAETPTVVDLLATTRRFSRGRYLLPGRLDRPVNYCARELSNLTVLLSSIRDVPPPTAGKAPNPTHVQLFAYARRIQDACERTTRLVLQQLGLALKSYQVVTRLSNGRVVQTLECFPEGSDTDVGYEPWKAESSSERGILNCKLPS